MTTTRHAASGRTFLEQLTATTSSAVIGLARMSVARRQTAQYLRWSPAGPCVLTLLPDIGSKPFWHKVIERNARPSRPPYLPSVFATPPRAIRGEAPSIFLKRLTLTRPLCQRKLANGAARSQPHHKFVGQRASCQRSVPSLQLGSAMDIRKRRLSRGALGMFPLRQHGIAPADAEPESRQRGGGPLPSSDHGRSGPVLSRITYCPRPPVAV
jgi:hypothetical protein